MKTVSKPEMGSLSKILATCGAIFLICYDLYVLVSVAGDQMMYSSEKFNSIMWAMIPCGFLLGVTSLCEIFDKDAKKPLAVISIIIFGITAIIRLFSLVYQVILIITGKGTTGTDEYIGLADFSGYTLLAVAAIFFMFYIIKKTMHRTTLVIGGVALLILIVSWVTDAYLIISNSAEEWSGFWTLFTEFFYGGLIWGLLTMISYGLIFACVCRVYDKSVKRDGKKV